MGANHQHEIAAYSGEVRLTTSDPDEFMEHFAKTEDICMMLQEEIVFSEYFRCYVLGREHVHIMRYDPKQPHHLRYVRDGAPIEPALYEKLKRIEKQAKEKG